MARRETDLPKPYWHEMASTDFKGADTASWIAVLPVGAIEQHGPHLPLATDMLIGEHLLEAALAMMPDDVPVTALPFQAVGKSNEHISSPGTLTLSWRTALQAWIEIGESVHRAGVRKLIVVNSHGGNAALVDIVAQELRVRLDMLVVAASWMRLGVPEGLFGGEERAYGIHGGDIETSLMLHFRPDLVGRARAGNFRSNEQDFRNDFKTLRAHGPVSFGWKAQDLNAKGVVGDAAAATAGKGRALAAFQAAAFVDLCKDVHGFDIARLWRADEEPS